MESFARLFRKLDTTTKTSVKLQAMTSYFKSASDQDALWTLWLLSGNTIRRPITSTQLKDWAAETAGIPRWLFDECYIRVGDLAEAVSLVVPAVSTTLQKDTTTTVSLTKIMHEIAGLRDIDETRRQTYVVNHWRQLPTLECMLFTKLLTGSFRVGVSRALAVRAMAQAREVDPLNMLHAVTGKWYPEDTTLDILSAAQGTSIHPYPFFLASPVAELAALGKTDEWQFEWKWDGIRGQIVRRGREAALWSRGEDMVSQQFPEILSMADKLPAGTVLDGEILPWKQQPLSFAALQTRLGRKVVSPALMETTPVAFIAYDVLEYRGQDVRRQPLAARRSLLERIVHERSHDSLQLSPVVRADSWEAYAELQSRARDFKAEGLMIKALDSPYRAGRVRGDWWKWKVDPLSVDAVLINAQRGHGRRSAVYSDYTFAVRGADGDLVPFAKAYSGLSDAEIGQVDAFVKRHTLERFGPVRTVTPELVFEIGFEGISLSKRHKSGVAVRFPRILRPRPDKPVAEIDTVNALHDMLRAIT